MAYIKAYGLIILFVCFLICQFSVALGSEGTADSRIVLIMGTEAVPLDRSFTVTCEYTNSSAPEDVASFDLTISYLPDWIELISVERGQLLDDCGWEVFEYIDDPLGFINISAIADDPEIPGEPDCYLRDAQGVLFEFKFQIILPPPDDDCITVPLAFDWQNCDDNVFATRNGDTSFVSWRVMTYDDPWSCPEPEPLPSSCGVPDSCVQSGFIPGVPVRNIDFHHGAAFTPCFQAFQRGDVNQNEVAFEIADLVMFENYWILGDSAFGGSSAIPLLNSDANGDWRYPTLEDYTYFILVIVGEILPDTSTPDPADYNAILVQDTALSTVWLSYPPGDLSAVHLVFDGEIEPVPAQPGYGNWTFVYSNVEGITRVLIAQNPYDNPSFDSEGILITYSGQGTLTNALAADYSNHRIEAIVGALGIPLDIDGAVLLIEYIFAGGHTPYPLESGDVNCDEFIDIDDVVYLIQYIFAGGPEPYIDCL